MKCMVKLTPWTNNSLYDVQQAGTVTDSTGPLPPKGYVGI